MSVQERIVLYGTLMQGEPAHLPLRLDRALVFLGPCRFRGILFDLGRYPGYRRGAGTVRGQLFAVPDPRVVAVLDAFEEYDPANPAASPFVRERIRLVQPGGAAWAYRLNLPAPSARRVPSGDWAAWRRRRGKPSSPIDAAGDAAAPSFSRAFAAP